LQQQDVIKKVNEFLTLANLLQKNEDISQQIAEERTQIYRKYNKCLNELKEMLGKPGR